MFPVTGDTYELRERLKAMGCRWDEAAHCWNAPDARTQADAQALADEEPLRKWRIFAGTLSWSPGAFTPTVWDAGLRACSLGLPVAVAMEEIASRITSNGGSLTPGWLERNVGRAYEHGTPPERVLAPMARKQAACADYEQAPKPQKPVFVETKLAKFAGEWARAIDTAWLADRSPVDPQTADSDAFLRALYHEGERVAIFDVFESQGQWMWSHAAGFEPTRIDYATWDGTDPLREKAPPTKSGATFANTGPRGIWYLCNPVTGEWGLKGEDDARGRPKWTRRSEPQVTSWRFFALETDDADPREWVAAIAKLPLRIAALYTSGGYPARKTSVHVLVKVDAGSGAEGKKQFDEWRELAKRTMIPLGADKGCMSAVRLTRLPGCFRDGKDDKATERYVKFPQPQWQKLLYLDPNPPAEPAPLIERAPVRDTLGPWERWAEATMAGDRDEIDPEELTMLAKGLAGFSGERAKELRTRLMETVRRWANA